MKVCNECGIEKPLSEYYKGKNKCKKCFIAREKLRYEEKKAKDPEYLAFRSKQKIIQSKKEKRVTAYIKKCKTCGLEALSETDLYLFKTDKSCSYSKLNHCIKCWNKHKALTRQSRTGTKTPEQKLKAKDSQLKLKYGITLKVWNDMYIKQEGSCKICKKAITTKEAHTDHDHNTGKVRGLLCSNCNTGIGLLQDSPKIIREALSYLYKEGFYGEE